MPFNVQVSPVLLQGKHNTPVLQILKCGIWKLSGMLKTVQWTDNWFQVSQTLGQCLDLVDIVNIYFLTKIKVFSSSERVPKGFKKLKFQFVKSL